MGDVARQAKALLASLLILLALGVSAFAIDEGIIGRAERAAANYRQQLQQIETDLLNPSVTGEQIVTLRRSLEDLRTAAQSVSAALAAPLGELDAQIAKLGTAPKDGELEAAPIAAQRKLLSDERGRLAGAGKQLDLIAVEAEQLIDRAANLQREQFLTHTFEQSRSVLNPALWYDGLAGTATFVERLTGLIANWWSEVSPAASPFGLLAMPAVLLFAAAAFAVVRRWLQRRFPIVPGNDVSPDNFARLARVVSSVAMAILIATAFFISVRLALQSSGLMTARLESLGGPLTGFIITVAIVVTLAQRVLSPGAPAYRLVDVDEGGARQLFLTLTLMTVVVAAEHALTDAAEVLFVPFAFSNGITAISAIALIVLFGLFVVVMRRHNSLEDSQRQFYFGWLQHLVPLVWLLLIVAAGALILGYVTLGAYIVRQAFLTALIVSELYLLHHFSDAAIAAGTDPNNRIGRFLRHVTGLGERGIDRLGLTIRTAIDIVLVILGAPILLLQWTITWVDLRGWVNTAAFGLQIGNVTLSPYTVIIALAILLGGIIATRLAAYWLNARILQRTKLDKGVQDSVRKGASYVGYILTLGFALTAAGLDFSNIAIVAGALGVGIGFGLQSIVNNFVSGLILLAERPVRVGDWVQIAVGEGLVKRINVRSTEIETFDNCTIIVPNSTMIVEPVKNWTHDDTTGRFLVQIAVSYKTDPQVVSELLLSLARKHKKVLTYPEPGVILAALTPSGMNFVLRASVADVFEGGKVASDIRFALLSALNAAGIEIAVPFQDVRLTKSA